MKWRIESIEQLPTKTLDAWSVCEVPFDGPDRPWTAHVFGFRREGCKGQASTPIVAIDPNSRRLRTRSGVVYELGPRSGLDSDGVYIWGIFKHRNGLLEQRDVTAAVELVLGDSTASFD